MNTTAEITADATNPRLFTCIMTKEVCDRDGEVVLLDGIDFKSFERNPVIMFEHGRDGKAGKVPVGKALSATRNGNTFEAKVELAERPATHPVDAEWLPDTLASLIAQKCLNCVSIGFVQQGNRKATMEDKAKYGQNTKSIITKSDLFELSLTGIPVNAEALMTARGKSLVPHKSEAYLEVQRERVKVPVVLKSMRQRVEVDIDPSERIRQIITVRVKGGLYA